MLSGDNVVADLDENDNVIARYFTNGVDNIIYVERKLSGDWKKYYYHTNHLGSVVAITDEEGDIINKYEYTDSWGNFELTCPMMDESVPAAERKPCIPNRYTYTGREWDEDAQMYFYRARWYDPSIQRFISEDKIMDYKSIYAYVKNNPLVFVDSIGLWVKGVGIGSSGGVGGGGTGDIMYVWDDKGNTGTAVTYGAGGHGGVSGSAGVTYFHSHDANTIYDFAGPGIQTGGGLTIPIAGFAGGSATVEYVQDVDGTWHGVQVTVGAGIGPTFIEEHVYYTNTKVEDNKPNSSNNNELDICPLMP